MPTDTGRDRCVDLDLSIIAFASISLVTLMSLCGRLFIAIQFSSFDSVVEFGMMRPSLSEVEKITRWLGKKTLTGVMKLNRIRAVFCNKLETKFLSPSSRGLGHRVFIPATGVRNPQGTPFYKPGFSQAFFLGI
jgi:hypothetical protein